MSYTALGDGVNLASRLEGLNKQYGTEILVSEAVADAAAGAFEFRRLDRVAVKGKTQGVTVLELMGPRNGVPKPRRAAARAYEEALERYRARDFAGALARLSGPPGALEADAPSRVLAERCRRALVEAPAADWDGVYVADEK